MDFCTITPSRGDRPQLINFCKHQLERMTLTPTKSYFIDYKPEDGRKDLIPRIQHGISLAKRDGFDFAFIVEDDDHYPKDYFERMTAGLNGHSFVGSNVTQYYNLRNNTYSTITHQYRSSLFHTGFRISALKDFRWPEPDTVWLDIRLWKFAVKMNNWLLHPPIAIGIKHDIGLTGGKAHKMILENSDPDRAYLKTIVDNESYIFYQSLKL